jgi:UMF1 family MFS transporter
LIGAAGGALQAASRNLLVRLADESRITAGFGLYALTGKVTAFLAPAAVALVTGLSDSQRIGISPVVALFVLGLVLLMFVQDGEGN